MRVLALFILLAAAMPAQAEESCPPYPPERLIRADQLFATLERAPTQAAADYVADKIWRFWFEAPDRHAGTMMSAAMNEIGEGLFEAALDTLGVLIRYCPDYVEAWNQRATLHFRLGDYDASLADVEEVLAREPRHFGALAGKAVMLMARGAIAEGQFALRKALAVHPWLKERRLLIRAPEQEL